MTPKRSNFKKQINQISQASHPKTPIQPNKPIQPSKPILWDTPDLTDPIPPRRQTLIPGPAECAKRLNKFRASLPCYFGGAHYIYIYIRRFSTCFGQQQRPRITMLNENIGFLSSTSIHVFSVLRIFRTYIFSVRPPICASLTCRTLIGHLNLFFFLFGKRLKVQSVCNCRVFGALWLYIYIPFFVLFAPCLLPCVIVAYFIYAIIA